MKRLVVLFVVFVMGCVTTQPVAPVNVLGTRVDETHKATYNGLALHSGQIVLTESPDATSYMFVLLPKDFYPFTHAAIISIEDGEPWVYDVTGEVKTFPLKKKLMDNVKGKMYRRKLFEYIAPNLFAEIYEPPPGADGEKIAAYARQKYKDGVEFDAYFDFNDHTRLFCTELVALAVENAGGEPPKPVPSNPNPSVVDGMKWIGVPPGYGMPAGLFADPSRYVRLALPRSEARAAPSLHDGSTTRLRSHARRQRPHRRSPRDHRVRGEGEPPVRQRSDASAAGRSAPDRGGPKARIRDVRSLRGRRALTDPVNRTA